MKIPCTLRRHEDVLECLSNVELATVLDGGSAHVVVALPSKPDEWIPAWIDLDGIWVDGIWVDDDEPGYLSWVGGVRVDHHV